MELSDKEELINHKLAVLYDTNPMNIIPETYEGSQLHDSQSLKFL